MLIYDGDKAGQNATQRAIPILEKAGLQVKVLQIKDAKDPDEFLKKFGPDKFKLLLEGSSNRVEYQLNTIRSKYDLSIDDQRVKFLQESAELIGSLHSSVQQEIYGHRVAEAAKISYEAMKLEISKAYKRRANREKKRQESMQLAPAKSLQPKNRAMHYDNVKSAVAEEELLAMALRSPELLDRTGALTPQAFSSAVLGKVYGQIKDRHEKGLETSLAVLEDLTQEEMSHVAMIVQRQQGPVNEQAFHDCIRTVLAQHEAAKVHSEDDLLAYQNKLRERKGIKA